MRTKERRQYVQFSEGNGVRKGERRKEKGRKNKNLEDKAAWRGYGAIIATLAKVEGGAEAEAAAGWWGLSQPLCFTTSSRPIAPSTMQGSGHLSPEAPAVLVSLFSSCVAPPSLPRPSSGILGRRMAMAQLRFPSGGKVELHIARPP